MTRTDVLRETALGTLEFESTQAFVPNTPAGCSRLSGKDPDRVSGELPGGGTILVASIGT